MKQHRPVSIVVKDGNCVHVVERVRVVAFFQDSSRIDWVEVLDGSASDMVVLVEDVARRQVDVGVRQSPPAVMVPMALTLILSRSVSLWTNWPSSR